MEFQPKECAENNDWHIDYKILEFRILIGFFIVIAFIICICLECECTI